MEHPDYQALLNFATQSQFEAEVIEAKTEYFSRTGQAFVDDPGYDARMAAFLEWYVLDRPSRGSHLTPLKQFIQRVSPHRTTPEMEFLHALTRTKLSVFFIRRLKGDSCTLIDLPTNTRVRLVKQSPSDWLGFDPGSIFEGRSYLWEGERHLSPVKLARPKEAYRSIKRAISRFRRAQKTVADIDLVHDIARLSEKTQRFRHLGVREIFSELVAS